MNNIQSGMEMNEEHDEQDIINPSESLSLPPVEQVEVRHAKALLESAGELPLDVARTILTAHFRTLRANKSAGLKRLAGGFIQCPSCSTPWMAALCRTRLSGCPRNLKAIKHLAKRARTHPGKLTKREKSLLYRYQDRKNVIEVSCLVCHRTKEEFFAVPKREREVVVEEENVEVERNKRKKKKKKRCKEINAGLLLTSEIPKKKKKDDVIEKSLFTTSTEIKTSTQDTSKTLAYPCKQRVDRAKVVIKSVPNQPLLTPTSVTHSLKEKRKAVSNLKKVMSRESAKSQVLNGGGKSKNSLSSFLDSLL